MTHQDVQTSSLEECDLVGDGERGEAGELLGELHRLNDALGGQLAELVPQVHVQGHAVIRTVILQTHSQRRDHVGGEQKGKSEMGYPHALELLGPVTLLEGFPLCLLESCSSIKPIYGL